MWTPRAIDDPIKDPFSSDTRRGDDSSSSASFKSPSSLRSEFEDHTHGILTPQLILIGEGDVPQWKSPSSGLPSTSTEIIEGLEKEVQWLQYTLNEAEKEWDEVKFFNCQFVSFQSVTLGPFLMCFYCKGGNL